MTITLTGTRAEIRRWLMRQRRMTGAKINYTCVETEDGLTVCIMQEGTQKDYPRQRIARQFRDDITGER